MRRLAQGLCVLAVLASGAARSQGTVPPWAQERAQGWSTYRTDARGQRIWQAVPFARMTQAEQWDQFMQHLKQGGESRRVALAFLGQRTASIWAEEALKTRDPEVALALYRLGYRQS